MIPPDAYKTIAPTDLDRRIWDEELADFLPVKLFDVHVHAFHHEHCTSTPADDPPEYKMTTSCPLTVIDRETLLEIYQLLFPGRQLHYLIFGWVFRRQDFDQHNAFTADLAVPDPESAALMLVHPSFTPEKVAQDLDRHGFRGLKPYRFWTEDEVNCSITEMLPEPLIELANERELIVMLHLGKSLGIADEQNVKDLVRLAERYPKVRWDLAHMARSSIAWPLERSIDRIKEVPSFWYDFSSVTHSDVFTLAFRNLPLDRIMFGTDLPCDLIRGTMISFGYGWDQIIDTQLAGFNITHCDPRPTYCVYETLRAARRAIGFEGFGRPEIEAIFYDNAARFVHPERSATR